MYASRYITSNPTNRRSFRTLNSTWLPELSVSSLGYAARVRLADGPSADDRDCAGLDARRVRMPVPTPAVVALRCSASSAFCLQLFRRRRGRPLHALAVALLHSSVGLRAARCLPRRLLAPDTAGLACSPRRRAAGRLLLTTPSARRARRLRACCARRARSRVPSRRGRARACCARRRARPWHRAR